MKTSILNVLMAGLIGLLPLQTDAAPKKQEKKREGAAETRKSAPKRAVQKAPSQPKRTAKQAAPRRSPTVRSAPKQANRKSPAISQQRRASSPKRALRTVERKQSTPNVKRQAAARNVQQRPAKERADLPKARAQQEVARSREIRKADGGRSESTIRRDVAERRDGGIQKEREIPELQRGNAGREREAREPRGERPEIAGRNDRANEPGRDRRNPEERSLESLSERKGRDLTVNDRDRDRVRDRERPVKERVKVDRRPPRDTNAQERERRVARKELRQKVVKERKRELAQRQERNRDRLKQFRAERQNRAAAVQEKRRALRAMRAENRRENLADTRREAREYWRDRADDIRDRVADRRDRLFDDDWWEERRWRDRPILVSSPWWWWRPAEWSTVNVFIDAGWQEPILYDYGTDVIYDDEVVYVHGESWGTPVDYSRRVIELANPAVEVVAEAPVVEEEWTPMGVWALVQENQGDAVMFFQISVNKQGLIRGAYANVMSGEELPIVGQVDKKTQRAAWHIGDETEKVFEAGMANLGQNEASCLVHVGPGEMQNWLLVRMESPNLPDRPAQLSDAR